MPPPPEQEEEAIRYAAEMPQFPGGEAALQHYFQENIKYPVVEREQNKQGTVYIEFIVEKDSSISNVSAVQGVHNAPGLAKEAIRVISLMPKWTPGRSNGKTVRVIMVQPVKFVLESPTPPVKDTNNVKTEQIDNPVQLAEEMPEFPGGDGAFNRYLQENIKYPADEKKKKKQGNVYISFVVEKDGSISEVKAVKEVPGAPGLTAEAIRVISQMPKWKPGKSNGRTVKVTITQPVKFILK